MYKSNLDQQKRNYTSEKYKYTVISTRIGIKQKLRG